MRTILFAAFAVFFPATALAADAPPTHADPPLLGKWFGTDGATFGRFGYGVPLEPAHLESDAGTVEKKIEILMDYSAGGCPTSWLEVGLQAYFGGGEYDSPEPTFSSISSFGGAAGPYVRPYFRLGRARVWGHATYVFGNTTLTSTLAEPNPVDQSTTGPEEGITFNGAVFGGGIDYAVGGRNPSKPAVVFSVGYTTGAPQLGDARLGVLGAIEGGFLSSSRVLVTVGIAQ